MGYLATYAINELAKGTITGKEGETFTAGRRRESSPSARTASLTSGDPIVFNKSNIGNFDFLVEHTSTWREPLAGGWPCQRLGHLPFNERGFELPCERTPPDEPPLSNSAPSPIGT